MKYIRFDGQSSWDHRPYFAYLEIVRSKMPEPIYRFAADPSNHDLTSPTSLHDAWLEQLTVAEVPEPGTRQYRGLSIVTTYLGPNHDLKIHITYGDVGAYELRNPEGYWLPPTFKAGHGDLLVHELRLGENDRFEHELVFSRGSVFVIQFRVLEHRIEWLAEPVSKKKRGP